jgi:hypothetical protein
VISGPGIKFFCLLSGICKLRCVSHEEDSLLSIDAPQVATESLFTAMKKVCRPSKSERGGQTLVGAVPGTFQSALFGVVAMVYMLIALAPQTFACYNCSLDEGLCLYQE